MPKAKKRKLDLDTQMADLSAEQCLQAHRTGKFFSLEHPRNSIARRLNSWEELEREPGVFSGHNAPLSVAVAESWGVTAPIPLDAIPAGGFKELSESCTLGPKKNSSGKPDRPVASSPSLCMQHPVETSSCRVSRVEAGSQPSNGKRSQLIPDGLQSGEEHLKLAKQLTHPFSDNSSLGALHTKTLEQLQGDPMDVIATRFKALDFVRKLAKECRPQQQRANLRASWTAVKLGTKPNTVLMTKLQDMLQIEDRAVPELCLTGMSITGRALTSPFFEPFEVPPSMSQHTFLGELRSRSRQMIERVRFMGRKSDPALALAICEKTQKEVRSGTMGPALTWEQVSAEYDHFQVTPSFGLAQGSSTDGTPKFRRIDDHTASGVNKAAHRLQKVPMTMVDYIGVMVKSLAGFCSDIFMTTEDMKAAYRQIPLAPADVRFAITGVYNPHTGQVDLHEMYGQPFGAGHAVPNFCRTAEWISVCAQKLFISLLDHFFDDFFIIEPELTIQSALFCLRELFVSLGFSLDPEKSQPPSQVCAILGILFNTESLRQQRVIHLCAKPPRVSNLLSMIDLVISTQRLSSALAASLVGKFGFLCSTLFGKVGRCCTGPLRRRQYSSSGYEGITKELQCALQLMKFFLLSSPARELALLDTPPILVYTDASDVPGRSPQRILGGVLFEPLTASLVYTAWEVPDGLVQKWLPKKSFMGQLELLAAPCAFETWAEHLQSREVILFTDNDSAAANLVKGYSPQVDSSSIVGEFWLLASRLRAHVYVDRVESKSNLADGPSRFSFSEIVALGGTWTSPKFGTLGAPSTPPFPGLALRSNGGREKKTITPEIKPQP
eukprot:s40_g20.t1